MSTDWIETELKLGLDGGEPWRWLRRVLGPGPTSVQTSHFFADPGGWLSGAGIGIRLRSEHWLTGPRAAEETRSLALKTALDAPGDDETLAAHRGDEAPRFLARRLELETALDTGTERRLLTEGLRLTPFIERWRSAIGGPDREALTVFLERLQRQVGDTLLRRFGSFENRRERLALTLEDDAGPFRIEIELDRTTFPGGRVDYELEVERTSGSSPDLSRTHRALVAWLERRGRIRTFPAPSKLERLESILPAKSRPSGGNGLD